MNGDQIRKILENPGNILIDVDPPPILEVGYPDRAISHPLSSEPWEEKLESIIGKNYESISIFSSFKVLSDYAENLASEYGIPISFTFSDGIALWSEMGLPVAKIEAMDVHQLRENLNRYSVIDVRDEYELKAGFIRNAINIPLDQIDKALTRIPFEKKYAVICAHGNRSRDATKVLSEYGFNVKTVNGGMAQWILNNYDIEFDLSFVQK